MRHLVKGFTLLEILIVMLIVTIIALIAVTQFIVTIEKSKIVEARGTLHDIALGEMLYHYEHGTYQNFSNYESIQHTFGIEVARKYFTYQVTSATGNAFHGIATRSGGMYAGKQVTVNEKGEITVYEP